MNIFADMDERDVAKFKNGTYLWGRCHCGETKLAWEGTLPTRANKGTYIAPLCEKCAEEFAESFSGGPSDGGFQWWAALANEAGPKDWTPAEDEWDALKKAEELTRYSAHDAWVLKQKRDENGAPIMQAYIVRCTEKPCWSHEARDQPHPVRKP